MTLRMVIAVAAICFCRSACALEWAVDTTADTSDQNPGDGVCEDVAGACSLRAAIQEANAMAGADQIRLSKGNHLLTLEGEEEDTAAVGDLDITDDLEIIGSGVPGCYVGQDAGGNRVFDVLQVGDESVSVSISNLVIDKGLMDGDGGGIRNQGTLTLDGVLMSANEASGQGGAIYNYDAGVLAVRNSNFSGNRADFDGGAISNVSRLIVRGGGQISLATPVVTVENSVFLANNARDGGAINNASRSALLIQSSSFTNNRADPGDGGAINNGSSGSRITIADSDFFDNVAVRNGGVLNNNSSGEVFVSNCTMTGNESGQDGGAMNNNSSNSLMSVSDCQMLSNLASRNGGAANNNSGGNMRLLRTHVANNQSGQDGGGVNNNSSSGTLSFTSGSVISNTATRDGGGIHSFGFSRVDNATVSGNTAERNGGGIKAGGDVNLLVNITVTDNAANASGGGIYASTCDLVGLKSTIVAGNTTGDDCGFFEEASAGDSFVSLGNNLDSDATCQLGAQSDLPMTDPMLQPLTDNGGVGLSQVPILGSPAIDAGDNDACLSFDQRGVARPQPGESGFYVCDIGAVEYAAERPEVVILDGFEVYDPQLKPACVDD